MSILDRIAQRGRAQVALPEVECFVTLTKVVRDVDNCTDIKIKRDIVNKFWSKLAEGWWKGGPIGVQTFLNFEKVWNEQGFKEWWEKTFEGDDAEFRF